MLCNRVTVTLIDRHVPHVKTVNLNLPYLNEKHGEIPLRILKGDPFIQSDTKHTCTISLVDQ